jgi:hypothetical protein
MDFLIGSRCTLSHSSWEKLHSTSPDDWPGSFGLLVVWWADDWIRQRGDYCYSRVDIEQEVLSIAKTGLSVLKASIWISNFFRLLILAECWSKVSLLTSTTLKVVTELEEEKSEPAAYVNWWKIINIIITTWQAPSNNYYTIKLMGLGSLELTAYCFCLDYLIALLQRCERMNVHK